MSQELKGRTAFVTGGTGFVGSHLVEELLSRGVAVRALVRADPKWLEGMDVEFIRGDLDDMEALRAGVSGVDYVLHVAGLTKARTEEALDHANVEGTRNLLRAVEDSAPGVRRVLVTSTLAAGGPCREADGVPRPVLEADTMQPVSMYGRSKARMEQIVWERFSSLPITIVRPPAVYGPRETDIYTVIRTASRLRLFPIVGRADTPRLSLVHVHDLVRGMADSTFADRAVGQTLYLSAGEGHSWHEIATAIGDALGKRPVRIRVPSFVVVPAGKAVQRISGLFGALPAFNEDKAIEARHAWVCSTSSAREVLGFEARIGLDEGLRETVEWYRKEGWL